MPGIADPGAEMASLAHENGINIVPLVGPSSILLAISASGFNGQSFTFQGYLPIKEGPLNAKLKSIEQLVLKHNQTQIFIETPYRNDRLFDVLLKTLNPQLKLCIARDITGENELIKTKTVGEWRKYQSTKIEKHPTIFLIGK